jgi:hypothetical protein
MPNTRLGFFIGKESDDDLLWFLHHIDDTDMSLHRNKLLRGVLWFWPSRWDLTFASEC